MTLSRFNKRLLVISAIALLSVFAFETANAITPPVTTPPATVPSTSSSDSDSSSVSHSGAVAGAAAGASAAGGAGGSGGDGGDAKQGQKQGQSATLNNNDNSRSGYYVLPGPVWTPPMAKVDCPTPKIENRSLAVGWGLFSIARGDTVTDDCYDFTYVNGLIEQCQYEQAFHYRTAMGKKRYPDLPVPKKPAGTIDYGPDECAAAKRLQAFGPTPPAPVTNNYITHTTTPPAVCPTTPVKRRVVGGAKPKNACGK